MGSWFTPQRIPRLLSHDGIDGGWGGGGWKMRGRHGGVWGGTIEVRRRCYFCSPPVRWGLLDFMSALSSASSSFPPLFLFFFWGGVCPPNFWSLKILSVKLFFNFFFGMVNFWNGERNLFLGKNTATSMIRPYSASRWSMVKENDHVTRPKSRKIKCSSREM